MFRKLLILLILGCTICQSGLANKDKFCLNRDFGVYSAGGCKSYYYYCAMNITTTFQCNIHFGKTVYNPERHQCDWFENVSACKKPGVHFVIAYKVGESCGDACRRNGFTCNFTELPQMNESQAELNLRNLIITDVEKIIAFPDHGSLTALTAKVELHYDKMKLPVSVKIADGKHDCGNKPKEFGPGYLCHCVIDTSSTGIVCKQRNTTHLEYMFVSPYPTGKHKNTCKAVCKDRTSSCRKCDSDKQASVDIGNYLKPRIYNQANIFDTIITFHTRKDEKYINEPILHLPSMQIRGWVPVNGRKYDCDDQKSELVGSEEGKFRICECHGQLSTTTQRTTTTTTPYKAPTRDIRPTTPYTGSSTSTTSQTVKTTKQTWEEDETSTEYYDEEEERKRQYGSAPRLPNLSSMSLAVGAVILACIF